MVERCEHGARAGPALAQECGDSGRSGCRCRASLEATYEQHSDRQVQASGMTGTVASLTGGEESIRGTRPTSLLINRCPPMRWPRPGALSWDGPRDRRQGWKRERSSPQSNVVAVGHPRMNPDALVVTGGGRGIGAQIALRAARDGTPVALILSIPTGRCFAGRRRDRSRG